MMKKTLCLFFVLALVAQICARPDGKDDEEKQVKEAAEKATKEGKDAADKGKEVSDDLQRKGKAATEELGKHVKGSIKQHAPKLSAMIRQAEKTGEKLFETGTNAFVDLFERMGL